MVDVTHEQQVGHAQIALRFVSSSSTPAKVAIEEFMTLLHSRPDKGQLPEIFAEGLLRTPEVRAGDTLLFNRIACAVVLRALRPEALNARHAFTDSLSAGIRFVNEISAELVRKLRSQDFESGLDTGVSTLEADAFYLNFCQELGEYVDASMAILDLAKQERVLPCFKGVLAERTVLALETPDSIETIMAKERVRLNLFFLTQCINTLRLEEPQRLLLLDRARTSVMSGQNNQPYNYTLDARGLIVDPHEPVRFSSDNMKRPTFREALQDLPEMVARACDLAA